MSAQAEQKKRGRVWDPFVRLFHWSLVAAFATAWWGLGENAVHETAGKIVLLLIVARTAWGFIGPSSARFENFLRGPRATLAYVVSIARGKPAHYLGHNPAGAAMIGLMLATLAMTAGSGILMTTTAMWGSEWIEYIHGFSAYAMLVLIVGHLLGVIAAAIQHRENLLWSMVTGRKWVPIGTKAYLGKMKLTAPALVGAVLVLATTAIAWNTSTRLLNASFWRMPKMVTAELAKNGCEKIIVSGPRAEIYPARRLLYSAENNGITFPEPFEVTWTTALEKRPTLPTDAIKAWCLAIQQQISESGNSVATVEEQPSQNTIPPTEARIAALETELKSRIAQIEGALNTLAKQDLSTTFQWSPNAFRQAVEIASSYRVTPIETVYTITTAATEPLRNLVIQKKPAETVKTTVKTKKTFARQTKVLPSKKTIRKLRTKPKRKAWNNQAGSSRSSGLTSGSSSGASSGSNSGSGGSSGGSNGSNGSSGSNSGSGSGSSDSDSDDNDDNSGSSNSGSGSSNSGSGNSGSGSDSDD